MLNIRQGEETPYYYLADGVMEAYVRLGNESVKADATELKRLVLRGKNSSYDALGTTYSVSDYAFSKLRERYKAMKYYPLPQVKGKSRYKDFYIFRGNIIAAKIT